jgi:hypothetical protein
MYTNTFELRTLVISTLLEPEYKAYQRAIDSLVQQNAGDGSDPQNCFMYCGSVYRKAGAQRMPLGKAPSLDLSLHKTMDNVAATLDACTREAHTVWQALLPLVEQGGAENGLPDMLKTVLPHKLSARSIPFENVLAQCTDTVRKNWASAEKHLHYFISLRLVL